MCPIVNPDFSEAFKPIHPGTYPCRIQAAELKTSETTGTKYISWELALDPSGKLKIFHNTPIHGRGAGMFKDLIHAAGDEKYESGHYDTGDILGHTIVCEIENETYINSQGQERMRPKVKEVRKFEAQPSHEADLSF
jgi:hypothetical protein